MKSPRALAARIRPYLAGFRIKWLERDLVDISQKIKAVKRFILPLIRILMQ